MDMSIQCLVYRTLPGPCLEHVGAMFSLALDQDNVEFENFQDKSTWSREHELLDKLQFVCLLKEVKFFYSNCH